MRKCWAFCWCEEAEVGAEDMRERAVRSCLVLMLCGTRWLAEFQRRVGKDGGSRRVYGTGRRVLKCGKMRVFY